MDSYCGSEYQAKNVVTEKHKHTMLASPMLSQDRKNPSLGTYSCHSSKSWFCWGITKPSSWRDTAVRISPERNEDSKHSKIFCLFDWKNGAMIDKGSLSGS